MPEIFASLGIYYLELAYLIRDNRSRITARRPLKLRMVRRKGVRSLRCSVGKSVTHIPLPEDPVLARKVVFSSIRSLKDQVQHVTYDEADGVEAS